MKKMKLYSLILVLFMSFFLLVSCDDNDEYYNFDKDALVRESPDYEFDIPYIMGPSVLSRRGEGKVLDSRIYAEYVRIDAWTVRTYLMAMGANDTLYQFDWNNLEQEPRKIAVETRRCRWLREDKLVYVSILQKRDETHDIRIVDLTSKSEVLKESLKLHCTYEEMRSSRNGKYLVIQFDEDVYELPDDTRGARFAVIRSTDNSISWITQRWGPSKRLPNIFGVAVSEDGKYIAAVGVNNGGWICLVDVTSQKMLWEKIPNGIVAFDAVCFSQDGKDLYVGGDMGLFCFDAVTGKIRSQWGTGRYVGVDVSPDGKLVAAGSIPDGVVYIFNAKTGAALQKLITGQYSMYCLAFSPDSTKLATSGVKDTNLKVWNMPTIEEESQNTSTNLDNQ